jgi:glycosyltransferase involved in cell wall biosynthesis
MPSPFPDRDYVSPGLSIVVPDVHFPRMRVGDRASHPWKHLRREIPHHWYADDRFPLMGFMNRDEATILYNIGLQFAGQPALEIGSWLGWSTCHLAMAGVKLDAIDPAHANPEFRALVEQALAGCGVSARVHLTATRSPEGVHALAAQHARTWKLFVIDGDHEAPAPECDVETCLAYAADDCAFVFHDLAAPAVAAGFRRLERAGFKLLIYQTAQIMGIAWRGRVMPVAHIPDPDVAWQLPHHLIGLPVSGAEFNDAHLSIDAPPSPEAIETVVRDGLAQDRQRCADFPLLRDAVNGERGDGRPSVCIVSGEMVGPFKNGGIGTAMTGLAEHLARSGCNLTVLYTGGVWAPDIQLRKWKARYAELGIDFVALSMVDMTSFEGPLIDRGFGTPYLVYQHLAKRHFDVVHFNDCIGEGSVCLVAKKLGLAFQDTLLVVALHSPSQWVLELNQTLPASLVLSAYNHTERLSVKSADVVWSPSRYLIDWAVQRGFELPKQTYIQQYCLPSQRLSEKRIGPSDFPVVRYGRAGPLTEIVFFGRLEERKGLRLFCNAIHRLRQQLADGNIAVTFLGKAETCGGMSSLAYLAERSREWHFPVNTITNLGQPEALRYLGAGDKLAVIASPVDNSPCTVYEALAWGIPFLATRAGGVPELVHADDQDHVLFDPTAEGLAHALLGALDKGGWIAAPMYPQAENRRVWSEFHANAKRFLTSRHIGAATPRVVALVESGSPAELRVTLESLASIAAIERVVVLNRQPTSLVPPPASLCVRAIDLSIEDSAALENELAQLDHQAILLIHSGIGVRPDTFADMLQALADADVDGFQPAAEVAGGRSTRVVPPLGGDPAFSLFEGPTFTGGLLIRGEALARAKVGRGLTSDSAFMGLADFCVTRGLEIWPYPQPVFVRPEHWTAARAKPLPARLATFGDCSTTDRYYMLAAGYAAATNAGTEGHTRQIALSLIDVGLLRVVMAAAWTRRRLRGIRSRLARENR